MPDALVCPKCSAPLDYPAGGAVSVVCPYCHTTVLLDQAPAAGDDPRAREIGQLIQKAVQLAQSSGHVGQLNSIEAIKFYRQVSGAGLADAKRVIDAAGPLHVTSPLGGQRMQYTRQPAVVKGKSVGPIIALFAIVFGGIILLIFFATFHVVKQTRTAVIPSFTPPAIPSILSDRISATPAAPPAFATLALEFGSEGVSPGHFDDARSIAVDNQGHLYVGEYSNGRVQMFDTAGKYLSEFSLGAGSYLQNLIADRKGTVYAVSSAHIYRFTGATGAALGEMDTDATSDSPKDYSDACFASGGSMYAISEAAGNDPEIIKLDVASGKIVTGLDTMKSVGESLDLFRITALSTGEIYALDRAKGVFKFAPDGRYVNRFGGGKTIGASPLDMPAAQLFSPENIATDSQGRIYVSDAGSCIKVFDKDGNYIDKFGGNEVAFGIAIDDQDNIYTCLRNRHTVGKYVIAKR